MTKERVRRPFFSDGSTGIRMSGISSAALVSNATVSVEGEVGGQVGLNDERRARFAVLTLESNGDEVRLGLPRHSFSRASRCSAMSAATASSIWLSSGSGSVCGIGDRGLACVFLGEARGAGVGHPDLYGAKSLRSEGCSPLRDALCAGGCSRHGLSPVDCCATCNAFGHLMEGCHADA